ncbi:adenosylcobalamin-dependent ribonucleoside-diphosphate reductase [Muricomes intestini]|uniref:adenosylcobalamin-dependent ribonucleoside-diphosphate reductase n=1 Tax=Muricomes intestini TaxID=1796634 RepID=UPI000E9A2EDA|nr:hypothetical protein [Lachnospiraceae bacterium]
MDISEWLGEDNQLGIDIWSRKYCNEGESFAQWLDRVSGGSPAVRELILEKKFLFGGRILSNRGLESSGQKTSLSNCYVMTPPEDNIEDIFDSAKKLARTYSYGGGCGIDISKISPQGAKINNAAQEAIGAIPFMDLYSLVTELIGQRGRRGALMISLSCSHPDIERFIDLKTDLSKVTKANVSVRISKEFMDAVKKNKPFMLEYTRETTAERIEREVNARVLFRHIAEVNWDYGEPGALFWDRIAGWNLLSNTEDFQYAGVNPCAEEPLPAGGSCLLGSLNLSEFVKNPFTDEATFDFGRFKDCIRICIRALNEVLDEGMDLHPLEEQRRSAADLRQIGLGIMGLADMLIKLGIAYGEEASIILCDEIGFTMADTAIAESALLAEKEGAYPKCCAGEIIAAPYFQANTTKETKELVKKYGLRNSQILTVAPTGTISTMLGVSGGIEPIYANYYERRTESLYGKNVSYKVYTKIVETYMKEHQLKESSALPEYFVTAMNLDYHQRIRMQTGRNFKLKYRGQIRVKSPRI